MAARRYLWGVSLGFALWIILALIFAAPLNRSLPKHIQIPHLHSPESKQTPSAQTSLDPPFTGVFSKFPRISALSPQQRRLTVVGVWNGDDNPGYLRHFLHGIQLNADALDLLFINRRVPPRKNNCLDFEKANLNITWGGNIKVVCMDDADWKRRHVDFLCSKQYGWDCNSTEYKDVTKEFATRRDKKNYDWRPFRGYVARDLFTHPENPFWAWMDFDVVLGNFARYPFNLLSQLSFLTGDSTIPAHFFLAGQLTAFNFDDPAVGSAWKKFPPMKTPAHFTKYIDGRMPDEPEEKYWSHGYMPSDNDLPGAELSYGIYPDIHGDDYYDMTWSKPNASTTYIVSGREVLLAKVSYSREDIETLIHMERSAPVDDLGSIGWTTGDDAIVDRDILKTNCSITDPRFKNCVDYHPLTLSNPPALRSSWVRFKGEPANTFWRRLERDTRPRGYERKLLKHHLWTKKQKWFEFPPFEITDDLVLRYNSDSTEVFRMGPTRNETLFYRKLGEESIG